MASRNAYGKRRINDHHPSAVEKFAHEGSRCLRSATDSNPRQSPLTTQPSPQAIPNSPGNPRRIVVSVNLRGNVIGLLAARGALSASAKDRPRNASETLLRDGASRRDLQSACRAARRLPRPTRLLCCPPNGWSAPSANCARCRRIDRPARLRPARRSSSVRAGPSHETRQDKARSGIHSRTF